MQRIIKELKAYKRETILCDMFTEIFFQLLSTQQFIHILHDTMESLLSIYQRQMRGNSYPTGKQSSGRMSSEKKIRTLLSGPN